MIPDGPTDNEVRARIECLKLANSDDRTSHEVITAAEQYWLFVTGQEQESEDEDTED